MKYEPTCRYRKSGDGYESRIFQTIAEIPEGWYEHWMDFEETDNEVITRHIYNEDTLGAIFDQEGIKGLRIVGAHLGVKSKSKKELIEKIMEAQSDTE